MISDVRDENETGSIGLTVNGGCGEAVWKNE